ncbi:DNA methyltransferase [Roseimicrobium sp. ORNL1]|uniref:DNA methyltransferase n=1 Tax=Roseimicrobium sp. ORNL1 TaxID=2711231 RepID=UPI0013E0FA95|nr:DNA methyltransferase [Roseimicrobium sp. ORNL1]QIF05186.1 site-specific DNA-methyltransferase [Roseimicrobium sp. ORNL1]
MPSLDFKGKTFVHSHHLTVPFRELVVDEKESCLAKGQKPSLEDNLIIHGDNLHALKALLPTHAGKVDCIFIDPPYNTGNEGWCYNDAVRSPLMKAWLSKEANPVDKEDMERHDKWLCMMWPRLQLLRELLCENGVIFISIDDNEVHRLRCILDEIFGDSNFLASIEWIKRYTRSNNARMFYSQKDHVLVYRKSSTLDVVKEARSEKSDSGYANPDNDERGPWITSSYVNPATKAQRKNLVYAINRPLNGEKVEHPTHAWKYSPEEHARHVSEKRLWWGADGMAEFPRLKLFLSEAEQLVPVDVWNYTEAGSSDDGSEAVKQIFGSSVFDNPKPVQLIEKILGLIKKEDALVLDSFAGSGTTAHAVLSLNKKDKGRRRFILVETEDYARDITAERVRRVIQGYPFTGTQRTELLKESLTWTKLRKGQDLVEKAESIRKLEGASYDDVSIKVEDGELVVTGEKKVKQKAEGVGGSFTFCELGQEMNLDAMLGGSGTLPDYAALARYVFHTATGRTLEHSPAKAAKDGFIGETDLYRVHLHYKPDAAWLRSNEAALDTALVDAIQHGKAPGKRALIFAAAKFMSQKVLTPAGIEFCQLPYAIHRGNA